MTWPAAPAAIGGGRTHHPPTHHQEKTMNLGDLITALEAANPAQPVAHGFGNPHSYRGDYYDLAFEPVTDTTVGDMLADARSAVGATYEGYKGGDFQMDAGTWCWLSVEGEASGETVSPQMLAWMLAPPTAGQPAVDRAAVDLRNPAHLLNLAAALDDAAEDES